MAWALAIGLGATWIAAELESQTVVGGISFGVIAAFLSLAADVIGGINWLKVYHYLTDDVLPERLTAYPGDLLDYALTANSLTYVQKALKGKDSVQYPLPESIASVADTFQLLMERDVFVDLFQNQEV